ncbi:hypothetical protein CAOG_05608 [Capsaspora owczarzaki ATCC 30864]|nr:hypothetical protein CAOG_05608 [Capsaspora owczarzaki ATCC 30864]|eukprot:XP_004346281.2 hypothetical protein CAOG_05608 [Capsaspora owczarzaki ATCC 30864]
MFPALSTVASAYSVSFSAVRAQFSHAGLTTIGTLTTTNKLTSLVLPDVVSVASFNATALATLTAGSLQSIGSLTFPAGAVMATLTLPSLQTITTLSLGSSALTTVTLPTLASVGSFTVQTGAGLTSLTLPKLQTITTLSLGSAALTSLTMATLTSVGSFTVQTGAGLSALTLPKLQTITTLSLGSAALTTLALDTLTSVGSFAVPTGAGLTALTLPKLQTVTTFNLGSSALTSLTMVTLASAGTFTVSASAGLKSLILTNLRTVSTLTLGAPTVQTLDLSGLQTAGTLTFQQTATDFITMPDLAQVANLAIVNTKLTHVQSIGSNGLSITNSLQITDNLNLCGLSFVYAKWTLPSGSAAVNIADNRGNLLAGAAQDCLAVNFPLPPLTLTKIQATNVSVTLNTVQMLDTSGPVRQYQLSYRRSTDAAFISTQTVAYNGDTSLLYKPGNSRQIRWNITALEPETAYYFEVKATIGAPPSSGQRFLTTSLNVTTLSNSGNPNTSAQSSGADMVPIGAGVGGGIAFLLIVIIVLVVSRRRNRSSVQTRDSTMELASNPISKNSANTAIYSSVAKPVKPTKPTASKAAESLYAPVAADSMYAPVADATDVYQLPSDQRNNGDGDLYSAVEGGYASPPGANDDESNYAAPFDPKAPQKATHTGFAVYAAPVDSAQAAGSTYAAPVDADTSGPESYESPQAPSSAATPGAMPVYAKPNKGPR